MQPPREGTAWQGAVWTSSQPGSQPGRLPLALPRPAAAATSYPEPRLHPQAAGHATRPRWKCLEQRCPLCRASGVSPVWSCWQQQARWRRQRGRRRRRRRRRRRNPMPAGSVRRHPIELGVGGPWATMGAIRRIEEAPPLQSWAAGEEGVGQGMRQQCMLVHAGVLAQGTAARTTSLARTRARKARTPLRRHALCPEGGVAGADAPSSTCRSLSDPRQRDQG